MSTLITDEMVEAGASQICRTFHSLSAPCEDLCGRCKAEAHVAITAAAPLIAAQSAASEREACAEVADAGRVSANSASNPYADYSWLEFMRGKAEGARDVADAIRDRGAP